jgi:lipid II:glycine glycyltransferase (peptidoglycan interpeptide bridge formation enzyme)
VTGLLPIAEVRSWLTGNRKRSFPISDACYAIADSGPAARTLIDTARSLRDDRGLKFFEMRGAPALRPGAHDPADDGFSADSHFNNYLLTLGTDTDAIRKTFSRKSVRQTINKSLKLGVAVRTGTRGDLDAFYRLYVLNRCRHGIPPQPFALFSMILERLSDHPQALLYLAEFEGEPVASLIMFRFKGVTYAKYEGVDESYREVLPIYALFWKTIEDAALAGDHTYDFGRTAIDNPGLCAFKSRWGTEETKMPYYFYPPSEGLSTVKSDSLKYRMFTGMFRRLPPSLSAWAGGRIFRHFG